MVSLAVHALALLGDSYLKPSVIDLLVPGFIDSQTFWTALGIVGGWLFVILGLELLHPRPDRPAALAQAASLHRRRVGPGRVHVLGAGHRRRHRVVPGRRGDGRDPRRRAQPPLHPGAGDMIFDCFGTRCGVWGDGAADARRRLMLWHGQFSRFIEGSELSKLNRDPRSTVPVSPVMAELLQAIRAASDATGGLVDGTLAGEIEAAGYTGELGEPLALDVALALAPRRQAAQPRLVLGFTVLRAGGLHLVRRPPGLRFDSGGLAKGLFADLIAERMRGSYAVDCGGDLRFGGEPRRLEVTDPFGGPVLHVFEVTDGAVATSGIGRRSWLVYEDDVDGEDTAAVEPLGENLQRPEPAGRESPITYSTQRPAVPRASPASSRPTALAPTALEAEWRAKAAVLSADATWLTHGGVLVADDGTHTIHQGASNEEQADRGPLGSGSVGARGLRFAGGHERQQHAAATG